MSTDVAEGRAVPGVLLGGESKKYTLEGNIFPVEAHRSASCVLDGVPQGPGVPT